MVARLIYGFRISVLFGLALTIISSIIGIAAGAVQGYFGGWVDLLFQRFIEIWTSIPSLYLLLIISSVLAPGFFVLLGILLLFSWVSLVGLVRAEFLRGRNFEYIMAARALGVSNAVIIFRHLLPNAMVATMTFLPFILSSSVMTLTALDFLGFGLPPGSPSLGELLSQGKANVQAPWLGLTGFFSIAHHALAVDLHRRSGARRLRPEKDVPMSAPGEKILSIRDLSIAFGTGKREVLAVDRVSFDIIKGETLALVGESGSGKSVTALSVMKLLPYPAAHHPSGSITFEGRELLTMPEEEIRHVRGNEIAIIFQEPMTSLNPLHTIEKQIREILMIHQGLARREGARPHPRIARPSRHPRPQGAARQLSASALRRPAPARDDRHGARQQSRPLDRRRADHRARRHGAGANPQAAQGHPNAARHVDAVHHPRSRHRAQDRRPGLRDECGQDRRARAGRARLHRARASLYASAACRRAEARSGAAASRRADRRADR